MAQQCQKIAHKVHPLARRPKRTPIAESLRRLSIEYLPIAELRVNSRNPRKHSRPQVKKLARSITTFGFNVPILVDSLNNVLAGHGRILASQMLGMTELPVLRLETLTEAQAAAFAIADNRLAEEATWDDRLLAEIFVELSSADIEFSLEDTGFSMAEIDLRIEGLEATAEVPAEPEDQIPTDSGPPVSSFGDLWKCGKHFVYCGDALKSDSFKALMRGKLAALVFTDPPYGVPIHGHASGLSRTIKHREFVMGSAGSGKVDLLAFLRQAMKVLAAHSVDGSIHVMAMDWRGLGTALEAGRENFAELKNICVWVKENAGMGSLYRSQHELFLVFKNGKKPHTNNVQLGKHGRNRTNVWRYAGMTSVHSRTTEEGNLLALHPTIKPIRLVADALLDCSNRGDIVLDPFLGSGTTLIAAERVGRVAYCMELDPRYVDAAVRRFEAYTCERARHAVTGKVFGTAAAKRGRTHG